MNLRSRRRLTPRGFLLIISGALILVNLTFIGVDYILKQTSTNLKMQIDNINENLEQLKLIDAERLSNMREEASEIEAELQLLEASFPELGSPIALYRISFDIAEESQVEIQSISKMEETIESTVFGVFETVQYSLELQGEADACILLIKRLERAGMDTISIENIQIDQELQSCRFDVLTMGNASGIEQ